MDKESTLEHILYTEVDERNEVHSVYAIVDRAYNLTKRKDVVVDWFPS